MSALEANGRGITILMADDDEEDCELTREALQDARLTNEMRFVHDGQALMDYLYRARSGDDPASHPWPGIILLDLNMPKKDGREALVEIRADEQLRRIPIVVLTTSSDEQDVLSTYHLGVSSFITKPVTFGALVDVMNVWKRYWLEIVELPNSHDSH